MLNFKFPDNIAANQIIKLANSVDKQLDELLFKNVKLPELPPRDIDTILNLAEAGLESEVSVLEWITLLDLKESWDKENILRATTTNRLIWQAATRNHGLRYLLYWRLVLHLDGKDGYIGTELVQQFKTFQQELFKVDKQRSALVSGFYQKSFDELNRLMLKSKALPKKVLAKYGLPTNTNFNIEALKSLARFWFNCSDSYPVESLLSIVWQLNDVEKDCFFSVALADISADKLKAQVGLVKEIIKRYSPHKVNSRYTYLTDRAKKTIRDFIGLMSFSDFKKLITQLTETDVASKLSLNERDIRQLNSRVTFWSNYSDKFLGFSVFVPSLTYTILAQLGFNTDDMALQKIDDANCEICALEFENHFVLEFLRGGSSGVRVVDKKNINIELLRGNLRVSSQQQLDLLPVLAEHDHLKFWQNSCEMMLRKKFGITPASSLRKFIINDFLKKDYSQKDGLPPLSHAHQMERAEIIGLYNKRFKRGSNKFYQGQIVIHKVRKELGSGYISFMHDDLN
ncbi:MAG: EH signature domain-containing protein [Paraglaciecola sp.]|nr:EH signature domain-containing protein [Paraglaciecola sp.]